MPIKVGVGIPDLRTCEIGPENARIGLATLLGIEKKLKFRLRLTNTTIFQPNKIFQPCITQKLKFTQFGSPGERLLYQKWTREEKTKGNPSQAPIIHNL